MKYDSKLMIAVFISMLMLFSGFVFAVDIETIHPYKGTLQKSFTEPAKTYLEDTYEINMPFDGKLQRINVREGTPVKKGQIVAQLVQEPLVQTANEAAANLQSYQAQYLFQQKTAQRQEKLGKQGFVKKAALDETHTKRKVFLAQIAQTKAILAIAKYRLRESTMYSPIDGVILHRYTQGGKWLSTGDRLLKIGNLNELEVICDVLSQEAQQVKIGDSVFFSSIGSPVILKGKIKRIYPAGFTKKSSLGVDEQRVNIIISIDNPRAAYLGVGYRLQAQFLVGSEKAKSLIVPRFSVLQDSQGHYYVFKVQNNKLYKQIIKVGIKTDDKVSITEGLSINDKIVVQPTADMHDGMKV